MMTLSELIEQQKELIESQSESKTKILNIIEFAESKRIGLGLDLYPMQKFILKVFYKIPLSDNLEDNAIPIGDKYNENIIHTFTEVECFNFLYQENRINFSYEEYLDQEVVSEILFFLGRRASKTLLVSVIFTYTAYLLLKIKNPHKFFGISRTEPITFLAVSNTEEGGVRQYESIKQMLTTAKFFRKYLGGSDKEGYWLCTPRFLKVKKYNKNITAKGDLRFFGSAATAKVRGGAYIEVALDEYAFFADSNVRTKAKNRDVQIYEATVPSTAGFLDEEGVSYGKSFVMTSPNGKKGDAYKKYLASFVTKLSLMLNMPSHWVNIRLSPKHLRKMYLESENSARQEFGAEFIESKGNFIKSPLKLRASINTSWQNTLRNGSHRGDYYLSADLAQSGDGIAFFITHKEKVRPKHTHIALEVDQKDKIDYSIYLAKKDIVVVDYYIQVVPEKGGTIHNKVILKLFAELYRYFNIKQTTIDQWSYQVFAELLESDGKIPIDTVSLFPATQESNSLVAKCFNRVVGEGRLMTPSSFNTDGLDETPTTLEEFEALIEIIVAKGLIKVEAPVGGHDDRWSGASRAIYMAENSEEQELLVSVGLEQSYVEPEVIVDLNTKIKIQDNKQVKLKKFKFNS